MGAVVDGKSAAVVGYCLRVLKAYPVRLAFVASLLLSLIAVLGVGAVGRDAAFYLSIAERVSQEGPQIAWMMFDWPWFTYLLAGTHLVTRLPIESCAYLWCALFMAGTCALLVDAVRHRVPAAAGWACLLVLAMPAANEYRDDIIREFGFWFFCVLVWWLALRWRERESWLQLIGLHFAVGAAMLFRLEAVMMEVALGLWLLARVREPQGRARLFKFVMPFLVVGIIVLLIVLAKGGVSALRVEYYLGLVNPQGVYQAFRQFADQFGDSMMFKYSRNESGRIIFFGMLAALLIKFVALMGPFSLPFLHRGSWQAVRTYLREYRAFALAGLVWILVLMLFFISLQFMSARYLSFLNLLAVPFLAIGAMHFASRFPRLGRALMVIGVLTALSNVVSTGAPKTQLVDAGRWVHANVDPQAPVYFEDGRVSYYAQRGYVIGPPRSDVIAGPSVGLYHYFVLEAKGDEPWLTAWLAQHQFRILASFSNRKRATMLVIGR